MQGLGGGLLAALAYVLVRSLFAEALWPRVFGLLASVWSVTVLVEPLIGGIFAGYGYWRGAFFTVAGTGGLLAIGAMIIFPASTGDDHQNERRFPLFRSATTLQIAENWQPIVSLGNHASPVPPMSAYA